MEQIPFERVERIKRELRGGEFLPGLVAVFSKLSSDDLLLVYVGLPRPGLPPRRRAITVADLPGADLSSYNGPTLGPRHCAPRCSGSHG